MNGAIFLGFESKHILGVFPTRWGATRVITLCKWPKFNGFHCFKTNHHLFTPHLQRGAARRNRFSPWNLLIFAKARRRSARSYRLRVSVGSARGQNDVQRLHAHYTTRVARKDAWNCRCFQVFCFFHQLLAIGVDTSEVGVGVRRFLYFHARGVAKDVAVPGLRITFDFKKMFLDGYIYFRLQFLYCPES